MQDAFGWCRATAVAVMIGWCGAGAHAAVEERVTSAPLADIEFDSARDGSLCPTCNFGEGNSRVVFTAADGRLWVAQVDWATGRFVPDDGRGTLVDTNAAYYRDFGNGPSWVFSQRGSELVYTRYLDGATHDPANTAVGWARMTGPGRWTAGPVADALERVNPKGTQGREDAVPRVSYGSASRAGAWWRSGDFSTAEVALPEGDSNRGLGLRWVAGTSWILLSGSDRGTGKQIFLYDTATGKTEQITSGPGNKRAQFMFFPPEFGGKAIFYVVVDDTRFDFYARATGAGRWKLSHSISLPPEQPYIAGSPEAFVHNGKSWIVLTMADSDKPAALSNIAIASIDPAQPELRKLTDASAPPRWRSDPEYFISDTGVHVYFTRARLSRGLQINEGVWRVDTGLGPPAR